MGISVRDVGSAAVGSSGTVVVFCVLAACYLLLRKRRAGSYSILHLHRRLSRPSLRRGTNSSEYRNGIDTNASHTPPEQSRTGIDAQANAPSSAEPSGTDPALNENNRNLQRETGSDPNIPIPPKTPGVQRQVDERDALLAAKANLSRVRSRKNKISEKETNTHNDAGASGGESQSVQKRVDQLNNSGSRGNLEPTRRFSKNTTRFGSFQPTAAAPTAAAVVTDNRSNNDDSELGI